MVFKKHYHLLQSKQSEDSQSATEHKVFSPHFTAHNNIIAVELLAAADMIMLAAADMIMFMSSVHGQLSSVPTFIFYQFQISLYIT